MEPTVYEIIENMKWMITNKSSGYDANDISAIIAELERLREERDNMENALAQIYNWSKAYPLKNFPEPDFQRARELLEAGGISLDSVSASNMRYVLEGIREIVQRGLDD